MGSQSCQIRGDKYLACRGRALPLLSSSDSINKGDYMSMVKICAGPNTVPGVDTSRWQNKISWHEVAAAGKKFSINKLTQGLGIRDSLGPNHMAGCKQVNIIPGGYHFIDFAADGRKQADFFASAAGNMHGSLPPMLDLERGNPNDARPMTSQEAETALSFLQRIEEIYGCKGLVYGGVYFFAICSRYPEFANHPLVIAQYGPVCPLIPSPWKTWTIFQYSGAGRIAGDADTFDFDTFNGSLDQLQAMVIK